MSIKNTAIAVAFVSAMSAVGGGVLAWWAMKHYGPQPEVLTPEPEIVQPATPESPHGSVIPERRPNKKPPKAPHKIPSGGTEERRTTVTVQPAKKDCPPVTVNLSTIRQGDGRRVIASSPDGRIIKSIDVPIEAALMPPKPKPWAGGLKYEASDGRLGAWIERDVNVLGKQIVLGADVNQDQDRRLETWMRVGVRF